MLVIRHSAELQILKCQNYLHLITINLVECHIAYQTVTFHYHGHWEPWIQLFKQMEKHAFYLFCCQCNTQAQVHKHTCKDNYIVHLKLRSWCMLNSRSLHTGLMYWKCSNDLPATGALNRYNVHQDAYILGF